MLWDMGRIAMSNYPRALTLFRKAGWRALGEPFGIGTGRGVASLRRSSCGPNGRACEELPSMVA